MENKKPIERVNTLKVMNTFKRKLNTFMQAAADQSENPVKISAGNNKIGETPNISLPPVITCGKNCKYCKRECYAIRAMIRSNGAAAAWCNNYLAFLRDPIRYFSEISKACYIYRFFRWHVSGDIVNAEYLQGMITTAAENPACVFLAFTKQFDIVNQYCYENGRDTIPFNLIIIFSAAAGLIPENPFEFPVAYIRYADMEKNALEKLTAEIMENAYHCPGKCLHCQAAGCGCWYLQRGGAVYFDEH